MKRVLKWVGRVLGVLLVLALIFYGWAAYKASSLRAETFTLPDVDIPVPFPLTAEEVAALPEGSDADAIALERALARGRHLIEARYGCRECHGANFGGGVMVDDPALGTMLGVNLTSGAGGLSDDYDISDWNRSVRHGLIGDGRRAVMPAVDHQRMSDRELSDIVAYIRSLPAVDNEVDPLDLGPVGTLLVAMGKLPFPYDEIDHERGFPRVPPEEAPTVEFGRHLAGTCIGCHREHLEGGPILAGDPSWLPAANLTALGWSFEEFDAAMRTMRRPDGSEIREPMSLMKTFAENITEVEMRALHAYIESVDERPTPQ